MILHVNHLVTYSLTNGCFGIILLNLFTFDVISHSLTTRHGCNLFKHFDLWLKNIALHSLYVFLIHIQIVLF